MTDNDKAPEWMTEDWLATMARTPGDNQPLAREILRLRAKLTQLDEHLPTVERLTQDLAKTEAELSTLAAELAKLREHADHDAGEILRLGGELADIKACDGPIAQAEAYGESMRHENDGLRAEVERLNIEIGRHPATRAWVTSGIRAIEEATSRADAAIRDRNEFAASELLAAIDAWAIAANVDWIKVVKDRAAELRQAASACPECDGSGTVEKCDWPGEHANRHQEPCPRGCKAAGAEVCGRCGATSAKDAEAKCRPEGDSCPGVGLWWRKAAGAAAPVEPNLLDKLHSAYRAHDEAVARLQSRRATPAADARQPDDAAKLAEVEKREADGIKLFDDLLATERAKVATMSIELDGMRNRLAASEKVKAELAEAARKARRFLGDWWKVPGVDEMSDRDASIRRDARDVCKAVLAAAERAGGAS